MRLLLSSLLLSLVLAVSSQVIPPSHYPADVAAAMDFTADPCNDFYEYACGGWLNNVTLPGDESVLLRAITNIEDNNQAILISVLQNQNQSATYPMIADFYSLCMDTDTIEKRDITPLLDLWGKLSVQSISDFMAGVGLLHSLGLPAFFAFSVVPDPGNPQVQIGEFDQAGAVLPDPSMYNATSPPAQQLLSDYQAHITTMFNFISGENGTQRALDVLSLESQLAAANLPADQIRDPYSVYNKNTLSGLKALTPNLDWDTYVTVIGADVTDLNIAEPSFFVAANTIVQATPVSVLESYLKWNLLHGVASLLPFRFRNATFAFFSTELSGQAVPGPRNMSCVAATDAALGNIVGQAFVDVAFGGASQQMVNAMITGIESAFQSVLQNLTWMDDNTKQQAMEKLALVVRRVGSPSNVSYYPGYKVLDGQFFESTLEKQNYDFVNTISGLNQAPNPNQWVMTADTVNAFYNPPDNSINFPAGIMQFPYFAVSRAPAENFGGLGVIMGHELTHGFDDQGRLYDGHGKLTNWWSNSSAEHFEASTTCMANLYSTFEVLPGLYINGNLTNGENIADNGGVKNAYYAYLHFIQESKQAHNSAIHQLRQRLHKEHHVHNSALTTPDAPLFFVSYAQGWCAKATDAYLRLITTTDVHSPPKFRVLGPLMNFPPFAATFQCPVGSVMNPTNKCTVW